MKIEKLSAKDIVRRPEYEIAAADIKRLINKNSVLFNSPFEETCSNLVLPVKKEKKSEVEIKLSKEAKKSFKNNKNQALRSDFIELMVKSNPKMNINLKILT